MQDNKRLVNPAPIEIYRVFPIHVKSHTYIDEEDLQRVSEIKWRRNEKNGYVIKGVYKSITNGKQKAVKMHLHRFVLGLVDKKANKICTCGYEVDHKNRNPLDNRKSNLRICTHAQNQRNKTKMKRKGQSKYRGVYLAKNKKWIASIRVDGKIIALGRFDTEDQAANAYNIAAIKHWGEYANLNIIHD